MMLGSATAMRYNSVMDDMDKHTKGYRREQRRKRRAARMPVHGKGLLTVQAVIIKKGVQHAKLAAATDHGAGTSGAD